MSQSPAIVIELSRPEAGVAELKFRRSKGGAALPLRIADPDQRIAAMRRDLPFLLGRFRKLVLSPDVDLDDERMNSAVFELRGLGYYLLELLVHGSGFTAGHFARVLADHLYPVLLTRTPDQAPLIEFLAAEGDHLAALLPVELIPLPNIRESELTAFLGFQAVVVRRRAAISKAPPSKGKIPTQFFAHIGNNLRGVGRQARYFNGAPGLSLATTWPTRGLGTGHIAITGLAETLVGLLHDKVPGSRKIAHFHCHFTTGGVNPDGHFTTVAELDFGAGISIPIYALVGTMAQAAPRAQNWTGEILVFLNACMTASAGGIGGNLVEHLLAAGFRHIIGSETLIPDGLAAFFAEKVYGELLAGEALGMAVYRARRLLIEDHGNPGGVLWTVFGDPELRLRPAAGT